MAGEGVVELRKLELAIDIAGSNEKVFQKAIDAKVFQVVRECDA